MGSCHLIATKKQSHWAQSPQNSLFGPLDAPLAFEKGQHHHPRMENMNTFGGFHQWGYPQIADFFDGKSIYKWMMTGRSIIYGNLHGLKLPLSLCVAWINIKIVPPFWRSLTEKSDHTLWPRNSRTAMATMKKHRIPRLSRKPWILPQFPDLYTSVQFFTHGGLSENGDPQVTHNPQGGATSMHPRISCTNFCSSLALLLSRDETVKRIEKYELLKAWITEHIIHTNTHQSYMMHYDAMMRLHWPYNCKWHELGGFWPQLQGSSAVLTSFGPRVVRWSKPVASSASGTAQPASPEQTRAETAALNNKRGDLKPCLKRYTADKLMVSQMNPRGVQMS